MTWLQQALAFLRDTFFWWVTIAPWQQGVRVRFGKRVSLLGAGVHFKLPVFDHVYMQPTRVRAASIGSQTLTTEDGRTIAVSSSLRYQVVDLLRLYQTLHNAHDTVEQEVQGLVAAEIYAHALSKIRPEVIEASVFTQITGKLERYGLRAESFRITNFAVVKSYRFITGEIGFWTAIGDRLETSLQMGERES